MVYCQAIGQLSSLGSINLFCPNSRVVLVTWVDLTKLLTRDSHLRSNNRANRYGRFNLVRPFYNGETEGGSTFKVREAKLWNRIPLDMRKKDTAGAFKNALREHS